METYLHLLVGVRLNKEDPQWIPLVSRVLGVLSVLKGNKILILSLRVHVLSLYVKYSVPTTYLPLVWHETLLLQGSFCEGHKNFISEFESLPKWMKNIFQPNINEKDYLVSIAKLNITHLISGVDFLHYFHTEIRMGTLLKIVLSPRVLLW